PVLVYQISPVGDQAPGGDEMALEIDRRQLVLRRKRNDQIAMNNRRCAPGHDQTAVWLTRDDTDGALDCSHIAHVDGAHVQSYRRRYSLNSAELAEPGGYGGIAEDRRARHARRDLFEQFQPFPAQSIFELHEARGVAARPR